MFKINALQYYSNKEVLYELVKITQGREIAFLGDGIPVRCIKAHCIDYLESNFKAFDFFKKKYNIYYSLAYLKNMPMFSYNPIKRKEMQVYFNKGFDDYFVDYDFGLDFDFDKEKGFKKVYNDTWTVKDLFDRFKVPYSLRFSGSGFHIVVPGKYFPVNGLFKTISEKIKTFNLFATEIKSLKRVESLDTSIYDKRRIWKLPYSFDYKTGNIVLPLTDEQFNHFDEDLVKPKAVLDRKIRDRGLLIKTYGLEEKELIKKCQFFVDEVMYEKEGE